MLFGAYPVVNPTSLIGLFSRTRKHGLPLIPPKSSACFSRFVTSAKKRNCPNSVACTPIGCRGKPTECSLVSLPLPGKPMQYSTSPTVIFGGRFSRKLKNSSPPETQIDNKDSMLNVTRSHRLSSSTTKESGSVMTMGLGISKQTPNISLGFSERSSLKSFHT